jgi:hypothetical protein
MTNCPVCNTKLPDKAKFCPECGVQLTKAPTERAWIIAMQERIKSARHSDSIYNVLAVVGILITVLIPFIMRYVQHFDMDRTSWLLTGVGILLFIGSFVGMWYDNNTVKALIKELEKGQEEEKPSELNEEDDQNTSIEADQKRQK